MKRLIVLAAGRGTRLAPLTDTRPKCMVELAGRPLIEWLVAGARSIGVEDITIVRGYRGVQLAIPGVRMVENERYATTNMVYSLWCARDYFGDDFIMSYSDIAYNPDVLAAMYRGQAEISVAVDRDWLGYWERRFDDVLSDAESLRVTSDGVLLEIGQKARTVDEIQGQYIGLVRFAGRGVERLKDALHEEAGAFQSGRTSLHPSRDFAHLYMTDLLQALIARKQRIEARWINAGWIEIDNHKDLELAAGLARPHSGVLHIER